MEIIANRAPASFSAWARTAYQVSLAHKLRLRYLVSYCLSLSIRHKLPIIIEFIHLSIINLRNVTHRSKQRRLSRHAIT